VQQGADFIALLDAARVHLPSDEYFLTAVLPASQTILQCIDVRTAAHYLDMVNLMAYDFYGSWTHRSGHHSQLYAINKDETSGSSGIAFLIGAGFPAKKINLGIPLYGRSFLGVSGPGHRFKAVGGEDGTFDYNQLPRKGAKEQVDKRIGAAMCVGGDGGFVSYDNPDTVKMKASYCKQKSLGVSVLAFVQPPTSQLLIMLFRGCFTGAGPPTHGRRLGASSLPGSKRCIPHR
jgi:chitinase